MTMLSRHSLRFVVAAIACATAFPWTVTAANNDPGAGGWKMIVLTGPTQVPVAAPAPVTDPGYQAELTSIQNAQGHLTTAQHNAISNWSGGGVVRWNQILLGLVASADLPPEPNSDGTYTFPSAATPFAFPQYPFANPPYAARSYSYVSVAQFEALKAAWYYKYLYNRPAPSDVDSNIQALIPTNGLPSYPSEDAVESGVAVGLLSILFPTQVAFINQTAAEQQQAALLSGKASASDIAAWIAALGTSSGRQGVCRPAPVRRAGKRPPALLHSGRRWRTRRPRKGRFRGRARKIRRVRRCFRSSGK